MNSSREKYSWLILRLGAAFPLLYAAYGSLAHPSDWIGYFPPYIQSLAPSGVLLGAHAAFTGIVGLWLVSGYKLFWPAVLTALFAAGIVVSSLGIFDIVFRDITLAAVGTAIAIHEYKSKKASAESDRIEG